VGRVRLKAVGRHNFAEPTHIVAEHPEFATFAGWVDAMRSARRSASLLDERVVCVSAAGVGQPAYEAEDEQGRPGGVFTRELCAVLPDARVQRVCWQQLISVLRERLADRWGEWFQRPELTGPGERRLFELASVGTKGSVGTVRDAGGTWWIRSGRLHGTAKGDVFVVRGVDSFEELEVVEVHEATACVVRDGRGGELEAGTLAFPQRVRRRIPVAVDPTSHHAGPAASVAISISSTFAVWRPSRAMSLQGEAAGRAERASPYDPGGLGCHGRALVRRRRRFSSHERTPYGVLLRSKASAHEGLVVGAVAPGGEARLRVLIAVVGGGYLPRRDLEGPAERIGARGALGWILVQGAGDEGLEIVGDPTIGRSLGDRRGLFTGVGAEHLEGGRAGERYTSGEQLEQDHADGVDVGGGGDRLFARLLGGDVGEGADQRAGGRGGREREQRAGVNFGEAEVEKDEVIAAMTLNDETVFRFKVAMHGAELVELGEAVEELDREAQGVGDRHRGLKEPLAQGDTL
jgi:hypothetical protein